MLLCIENIGKLYRLYWHALASDEGGTLGFSMYILIINLHCIVYIHIIYPLAGWYTSIQ